MKKLFALLLVVFMAAGLSLQAQDKAVVRVAAGQHLVKFPTVADQLADSLDYVLKEFDLTKKTKVQYYTIPVYVDTVATSHDVASTHYLTINLQQSYDYVTWANLDTVLYYGASGDSTFNFQDLTTGSSAPYMRVKATVVSTDSVDYQLDDVWGRFLDK
jgi:hypothetical protein